MTDGACLVAGVCEVTLETSGRSALEAFYTSALGPKVLSRESDRTWLACGSRGGSVCGRRARRSSATKAAATCTSRCLGGDRSLYCEDPAGNVLELWDFFHRGEGSDGVDALASSSG
jgi:hypothetical protein